MLLYLAEPLHYIVVRCQVSCVKRKQNSVGSLVIGLSYGSESLLPSCVPDLHFDNFSFHLKVLDFEVDTYSKFLISK